MFLADRSARNTAATRPFDHPLLVRYRVRAPAVCGRGPDPLGGATAVQPFARRPPGLGGRPAGSGQWRAATESRNRDRPAAPHRPNTPLL
nr:MAG TPA: hypothetical protein [Caudoviricetes sp.]